MRNKNFHNHKVGHKHEIKLRNIVVIFLSILIGLGSIVVFAQQGSSVLNITTDLNNAVQTIKRIIISTDGTDIESNKLFDLNTDGAGSSKIYTTRLSGYMNKTIEQALNDNSRKVLGIDGNDNLIFLPNGVFSGAGGNGNGTNGGGDNLGNHTATGNLNMGSYRISNDGTTKGIQLQSDHTVKISSLASNSGKCVIVDADGILGLTTCGSGSSAGGTDGINGTNGIDGATGATGATGAMGATGPAGPQGPAGPAGADGFLQAGIQGATPFWNGSSRTTTNTNIYNIGSNVGIGVNGGTLTAKLNINGMIKLYDNANNTNCYSDQEGSIRYQNNCFQGCDGTSRIDLGGAGCNTVTNYQCTGTIPANSIPTSVGTIPANTYWYYSGTAGPCTFICDNNHTRNSNTNQCEIGIRDTACIIKPLNSSWNTTDRVVQIWDGTQRSPSNIGYYNTTPTTANEDCRFICDTGYMRNYTNETCDIDQSQQYSCQGTLQTGAIANNITPVIADTGRTYSTTPGQCTFECNSSSGYIRNIGTQYCCNIPDNSTLYQSGTTTVQSLRGSAIRGTSLWGINTVNNTGITYQNGNCNFVCDTGFTRNGDLINPLCE